MKPTRFRFVTLIGLLAFAPLLAGAAGQTSAGAAGDAPMVVLCLSTYAAKVPSEAAKAAVIVITIGPIIALYPFLQRYFIKGIFLGSLKG